MAVSADAVTWGYRFFLGRDPESPEAVSAHLDVQDELQLAQALMRSPEFAARRQHFSLEQPAVPELAQLEVDSEASPEELAACLDKIKAAWSHLGEATPHFSVLTDSKFLPEGLAQSIDEFWETGRHEAELVVRTFERHGLALAGTTGLEYGCGVGRVTTGLSRAFARMHAYDISPAHLELARRRARELGVGNVQFHECAAGTLLDLERCDAFYSRLVFQHNPPPVISELIRKALGALRSGGLAVFQVPSYISGYHFRLQEWLKDEHLPDIQMHCLPQHRIFALIAEQRCELLEMREDNATGGRGRLVSNMFVVRKT